MSQAAATATNTPEWGENTHTLEWGDQSVTPRWGDKVRGGAGDKNKMLIRRRPSIATLVAVLLTLALGSQTGSAAQNENGSPEAVRSVEVTATDGSSVTIAWPPSREMLVGYGVYVNGDRVGTETPERVRTWRDRESLVYTIRDLACGKGYTVGVDVVDRDDDRSSMTSTTVSTSACPDATAPSAPTGVRQVATTESSVMLAWSPSSDNVGVVEYGLYVAGLRVATVSEASATLTKLACGTSYLIGIDAADAAGNRSAHVNSSYRTAACPTTNQSPTTPTVVKVAKTTETTVALTWTASTDDVAVTGYGLYLSGTRTSETTGTNGEFTGLRCGTTYTLGVDARDAGGKRSAVASLSTATSPCSPAPPSSSGAVTQTIANGASLANVVNWRGVYDRNGDRVEDDPGSMQFLVDGTVVLSELHMPFGDSFADGSITVPNGRHTFEVRALNDSGTLLAQSTVTATIGTTTPPPPPPPPPPPSSTGAVTQTIANGARLANVVNWRGVYDRNGDRVEDDPGSMQFLVDGTVVLSELHMPFGDSFADGSITVGNGSHTFEVRALNDNGTLLAQSTVTATIGTTTPPPTGDAVAPSQPGNLRVTSATPTGVGIAWSAATDNVGVTGYDLYRGTSQTGTTQQTNASFNNLTCGSAYQVGVDANDAAGNSSPPSNMAVTTSACADTQPPTAPTNVTVSTRTTTSISLTWGSATDNVGIASYGIYNGAALVATTAGTTGIVGNLTCGTNYTLGVNAVDATGNNSSRTTIMVSTQPCGDTTAPTVAMTAPANGSTTAGTINASANASDNVGVTRVEFFRDGVSSGSDTSTPYSVPVNTTTIANGSHTLSARAYDAAGNVGNATSVTVTVSNTPPASGSVTQTIANGATLPGITNWRGTYDANGDGAGDDPGKMEFLIDNGVVLVEDNAPFGDTFATGTPSSGNGQHTFQVKAYSDAGQLLASNTVTATVVNQAPPPPPPPSPPPSGYPNAGNTGVPAGTTLTPYTGPSAITTAGTVIDGKTLGCVQIQATGVVIRNSRLTCNPGGTAVVLSRLTSGAPALIENSEINCLNGANSAGFGNSNLTIRGVDIFNCENGLNVQRNVDIRDSYIHDGYNDGDSHMDGMQFTAAADNVQIIHNTILGVGNNGQLGTSSLIADLPGHSNWLIENNLFGGGAYTVYCVAGRGTNWVIRNNRFATSYGRNGTSGAFGFSTECSDETQSGNVIHETGQPITLG